jgi:hypothetical protein
METPAGFLAFTLVQYAVICCVVVALCDICRRLFGLDALLTFCAALLALGTIGYLAFWLGYANYAVFSVVKIVVLAALLVWFGVIAFRRELSGYGWLVEPLAFATLFALIVVTLGFANGGLADPAVTAQNRFSHPLPVDNLIPYTIALAMRFGQIASPLIGEWYLSDRPTLQTGLYLQLTLRNPELAYEVVAAWLQATCLFGVWGLAVAAKIPPAARRLILLACCLLPTAIINTFYTWPKLLPVSYLLLVFALLFCRKPQSDRERSAFGVLIGGLAALSILSHGGSLFALLGFAATVLVFWAWPPLKTMMYGAAALLALYVPWMVYQHFDPPANRLLKWHFAGVESFEDKRSFLAALCDSYGALSWSGYFSGRVENVMKLVGFWPSATEQTTIAILTGGGWNPAGARSNDFFQFLPSLHVFSFALICAIALLPFLKAEHRAQRDASLRMLVALVAICFFFVLLIFTPGQTINHQGTYAMQIMAAMFSFIVLMLRAPWLAFAFLAVQAVTVSATYAFSLKFDPASWPLTAACIVATLALAAYALGPTFRRTV